MRSGSLLFKNSYLNTDLTNKRDSSMVFIYTTTTNYDDDGIKTALLNYYKSMKINTIETVMIDDIYGNSFIGGGRTMFTLYKPSDLYGTIQGYSYWDRTYKLTINEGKINRCIVNIDNTTS